MNSTDEIQSPPPSHPLQRAVSRLMRKLGFIIAFFLFALTVYCLLLVVDSVLKFNTIWATITAIVIVLVFIIATSLSYISKKARITITNGEDTKPLDAFSPIYIFLIVCGFLQTILWVMCPDKDDYEPRSVFILAVAGAFVYFRSQYEKNRQK